jgi:hypothetical protein
MRWTSAALAVVFILPPATDQSGFSWMDLWLTHDQQGRYYFDRGEFVYGRRTQSAKYFIQKEGDYTLPAIELKWWSLSTNRLVTAALPAVHFTAAANANYIAELPPEPAAAPQPKQINRWTRYKFWIRVVVPYCIAALVLLWIAGATFHAFFVSCKRGASSVRIQRQHIFVTFSLHADATMPSRPTIGS